MAIARAAIFASVKRRFWRRCSEDVVRNLFRKGRKCMMGVWSGRGVLGAVPRHLMWESRLKLKLGLKEVWARREPAGRWSQSDV